VWCVPEMMFCKFFKGVAYVQFTIHSAGGSNEAPKTPRRALPPPLLNRIRAISPSRSRLSSRSKLFIVSKAERPSRSRH
jgi:hypothetical protein